MFSIKFNNILYFFFVVLNFQIISSQREFTYVVVRNGWLRQNLDNFDPNNTRKWSMKYLSNDHFYEPGGPIIIDVGGQHPIKEENLMGGLLVDITIGVKGYLFSPEHRYYGGSAVFHDLKAENLKFLSMDQAILDLKNFITHIKSSIPSLKNSKVILKGHSYSGGLAFWFKLKFPNLVDGVWASSPKILPKYKVKEIGDRVGESVKEIGGEKCYQAIKNGISELWNIANTNGIRIKRILNLCNNYDKKNSNDEWNLFYMISDAIVDVVANHSPSNRKINTMCEKIMEKESHIDGVADFFKSTYDSNTCIDATFKANINKKSITIYTQPETVEERLITYQKCSEFGWFPTNSKISQFLKFPGIPYYAGMCGNLFGSQMFSPLNIKKRIDDNLVKFNDLPKQNSNILITHGSLDPFKVLGEIDNVPTEIISSYGHAQDLNSITYEDLPQMEEAKNKIKSTIYQWVGKSQS